ncbi:MAG TPA: hypothetical protein PKK48_02995, partial [Phycisphaerae bacterium]|nr:hypothetical protein [Phycisphaerae bacterium]
FLTVLDGDDSGFKPADNFLKILLQLGRFGFVGLMGTTVWLIVTFVSYYLTYLTDGRAVAGRYTVMLRLAQPIYTLAIAIWAVIYTHTAHTWQHGDKKFAMERMDVMFRRVMAMVLVGGWAIILSEPAWSRILGPKYCGAGGYLPGLLMMFAAMSSVLSLFTWGRILGRQWSIVIAGAAAVVLNVAAYYAFERFFITKMFSSLSAGVGVFAGSVMMTVFYFTHWKIKISIRSAVMLLLPAIFLLSNGIANSLCAAAITLVMCYFAFTPAERKRLFDLKNYSNQSRLF